MMPHKAAELLRLDYRDPGKLDTIVELDIGGVQARIVRVPDEPPVLLIRGTNEAEDWKLWNFLFKPQLQVGAGDTRRWARGFLGYAERIYGFAKLAATTPPGLSWIIGHSLGGAAAQILGPSLGIKTMTFGSPRPLFDSRPPIGAEMVANHILSDDWVTKVPIFWIWPPWRFKFVGAVVSHDAERIAGVGHLSDRHAIERYHAAALTGGWTIEAPETAGPARPPEPDDGDGEI